MINKSSISVVLSDDDVLRLADEAGIRFDTRWGTCFTGNVQLKVFARLIEKHLNKQCKANKRRKEDGQ